MLKPIDITPRALGKAKPAPMFDRAVVIAPPELQAARKAVCAQCKFNEAGICRQCCGGVSISTLINLTASQCGRRFWKE